MAKATFSKNRTKHYFFVDWYYLLNGEGPDRAVSERIEPLAA